MRRSDVLENTWYNFTSIGSQTLTDFLLTRYDTAKHVAFECGKSFTQTFDEWLDEEVSV